MAQAGPNNQFGGRQEGLASLSYQSPGGNAAPVAAARKQAPTKPISTSISEMSIMPPYRRRRGRSVLSYVNGGLHGCYIFFIRRWRRTRRSDSRRCGVSLSLGPLG